MRARTIPVWVASPVVYASTASPPIDTQYAMRVGVIVVFSAASNASGTLALQGSNYIPIGGNANFPPPVIPATFWATLASVPTAGNGTFALPATEICARWIRVVYTPAAGNGNLDANAHILGWQ